MFLYSIYKWEIYKTISTTLSALSLQLSKLSLAQQFDSLEDDIKAQFLSLTNVFTSDTSSFSEKLLGKGSLHLKTSTSKVLRNCERMVLEYAKTL